METPKINLRQSLNIDEDIDAFLEEACKILDAKELEVSQWKEVQNAAKNRTPYLLTKYLQELAANFHQFYAFSKVLVNDEKLMYARLSIVKAVTIILKSAMNLIAVEAPEKM